MKFLDLGQYKKTDMDEKFATFLHPKGHKIQVYLKGLSKLQQEQMKRLPLAKGGEVKGEDDSAETKARGVMRQEKSSGQRKEAVDRQNFDEGTPDNTVHADDSNKLDFEPVPPASPDHSTTININGLPAGAAQSGAPQSQPQVQAVPEQPSGTPLEQQAAGTLGAANQQQQAVSEQQQIDTAKAQAQVPIEEQQIANAKTIQARQDATVAELQQHTQDFADYIKANPVNANAYGMSQTESQRANTAVGLFLGGFGGGLTGTNNDALDFLNKQIDRSIDAQKTNISNQATVYSAYQHLYNDENVSTALTKVSMNDALVHQAGLVAAQLGTQQAKQAADALQSKLQLENAQLLYNAAGILNGKTSGTPSGQTNEMGQPIQQGREDRILSPGAEAKYNALLYDPSKTPEQKAEIVKEYNSAFQVDRALEQVDKLFPELVKKATYAGLVTGPLQDAAEKAGGHGGIGGAAGALAAPVVGAAGKILGGQQQVQYETARDSLRAIVAGALHGLPVTPTEAGNIVDQFIPTKFDTEETARDKLEKLKEKIISLARAGGLHSIPGMTNLP